MHRTRVNGGKRSSSREYGRHLSNAAACAVEALESRVLMSVNVTTYHYNQSETGANTNETTLTPSNVNVSTFGKIADLPTDGQIYAQPLIMTGLAAPGGGTEDLVYVATENDSVYAFNASGTSTTPVWKTSLLQTGETAIPSGSSGPNIAPEIGITGTPVIDPATNTLYVVGNFKESNGTFEARLYALDIATGAAKDGGPVQIAATVNGTGAGSSGGKLTFSAILENQRPALALANGQVYVAFGSHGDGGNYHGWVFAYNDRTLAQDYVWCNTPNGSQGGIWMSGGGLSVDSSGDLYLTSGNGTFDANTGGSDYGMALVKLSPSLGVVDYFSPYNEAVLSSQDNDYGSGNAVLLPPQLGSAPDEVITDGKWGGIFLNNSDTGKLGEFTANGPNKDLGEASTGGSQHNTFSYWNGTLFIGADGEPLKAFAAGNGTLATTVSSQSTKVFGAAGGNGQGVSPTISSNGTSNGIVWAIDNNAYVNNYTGSGVAIVFAYNANNLGQVLWSSNQAAGGRDTAGTAIQFTTPVVANGYVYVGSGTGLTIYGNIPYSPPPPPPPPPTPPPAGAIKGFGKFTLTGADGTGIYGSSSQNNNNGAAPTLSTDTSTLTVTTAANNEASSAFYNAPVGYQNFTANFTYTDTQGNPPADGITFTLQDDPRGAHAIGGGGGYLGYTTGGSFPATAISPSFAVEFNVYQSSSTSDATNGGGRTNVSDTGPVNLSSGDPIVVALSYNSSNQTVIETLTDSTTNDYFSTVYANVNLPSLLGSSTAYVGFTGGTGGANSLQTISNFSYYTLPPVSVTSVGVNANNPTLAGAQRSMVNGIVYTFSQAVTLASTNAFSIGVHGGQTGTVPTLSWSAISPDAGGASTQWAVNFSGAGVSGGSIGDGVYDLTLNTSAISVEGNPAAAITPRATDTFYRLYGDAQGTGRVNTADYTGFLSTYGLKSTDPAYLGYFADDGTGKIDTADYNAFLGNYGKKLSGFTTTI